MKPLAFVLASLALGACVSTGQSTIDTVQRTTDGNGYRVESTSHFETRTLPLNGTPAAAWQAIRGAYEDVGVPLAVYDTTTMELGNPGLAVQRRLKNTPLSRYLNCGTRPVGRPPADEYNVRLSVVSRVRAAAGGGSELQTRVTGEATQPGVAGSPINCATTGALEQALANAAQLRLAGGGS